MGELTGHGRTFSNWLVYSLNDVDLYNFKQEYQEKNDNR